MLRRFPHAIATSASVLFLILVALVPLSGCPPEQVTVPGVVGQPQDVAQAAIEAAELILGNVTFREDAKMEAGDVLEQAPQAGASVLKESAVDLVVSSGPAPTLLTPLERRGSVTPPSDVPLIGASVVTSFGTYPVGNAGSFAAQVYEQGPELASVVNANGEPMLLGWLADGENIISARTTAEVLAYFALGLFAYPGEASRVGIHLLASENLVALESAIADSLVNDANSMSVDNPAVTSALAEYVDLVAAAAQDVAKGVQIDPAQARSGIQVDITQGVNTIRMTNMFRRRAYAYLEQTGYTPESGAFVPETTQLDEFKVDPVTGLGSVVSTLINLVSGNWAYDYVNTKEIELPVIAGSKSTSYRLSVVGMGIQPGDYDQLPSNRKDKQLEVAVQFVALDMVLPFITAIALPAYGLYSGDNIARNISLADYLGGGTASIVGDWLGALMAVDGFSQACLEGRPGDAALLGINAIADTGGMQTLTIELLALGVYRAGGGGTPDSAAYEAASKSFATAQKVLYAVGIANMLLTAFDLGRITVDIAQSDFANIWDIDVIPPKVVLTPDPLVVASLYDHGQEGRLDVSVPEASGSVGTPPVFVYHWAVAQQFGTVSGHGGQTEFDSSSPTIYYRAMPNTDGEEDVTVTVYQLHIETGNERQLVGNVTGRVHVKRIEPETYNGQLFYDFVVHSYDQAGFTVGVEFAAMANPSPNRYHVHGYNFNDTYYYGTQYDGYAPPWYSADESTVRVGLTGGGCGPCGHTEDNPVSEADFTDWINWALGRFDGGIWEITPEY